MLSFATTSGMQMATGDSLAFSTKSPTSTLCLHHSFHSILDSHCKRYLCMYADGDLFKNRPPGCPLASSRNCRTSWQATHLVEVGSKSHSAEPCFFPGCLSRVFLSALLSHTLVPSAFTLVHNWGRKVKFLPSKIFLSLPLSITTVCLSPSRRNTPLYCMTRIYFSFLYILWCSTWEAFQKHHTIKNIQKENYINKIFQKKI